MHCEAAAAVAGSHIYYVVMEIPINVYINNNKIQKRKGVQNWKVPKMEMNRRGEGCKWKLPFSDRCVEEERRSDI